MKKAIIAAGMFLLPGIGYAHGNIFSTTADSIAVAIEKFQTEESAIVNSYKGLRAWQSGSFIKVRFYYGNADDSLLYQCEMKHHGNGEEEIVCANQ